MNDSNFQIKHIGRRKELQLLQGTLNNVIQGHGTTVFILGDAGVGKTMLVDEFIKIAKPFKVKILRGCCYPEDTQIPYASFKIALKSVDLDFLFTLDIPKIESIYLMNNAGLLISKVEKKQFSVDSETFTAMLSAIGAFVRDSMSNIEPKHKQDDKENLNVMGYGNYQIVIEKGNNVNLVAIISGRENQTLVTDMREILSDISEDYKEILPTWDGTMESLHGTEKYLNQLLHSEKYNGRYIKTELKENKLDLHEMITKEILHLSTYHPIILIIEDIHWADSFTISLLQHMSGAIKESRILLLCTSSPLPSLKKEIRQILQDTPHLKIKLEKLTADEVNEIIDSILEKNNLNIEFRKQLYIETEGNPSLIAKFINLMIDENIIMNKDGIWTIASDIENLKSPFNWVRLLLS